jgi:hypothetical protein
MLAAPSLRGRSFRSVLETYTGILARLYRAVADVSECRILVDSSKSPAHGFVLRETPGIELRALNLVRDSRAVAFSWQRQRVRPEVYWEKVLMPRYGVFGSSREWVLFNGAMEFLCSRLPVSATVRYEDLAREPKVTLRWLLDRLHIDAGQLDFFLDDRTMLLGVDHTVSGNPIRFKSGAVTWREDAEWKKAMRGVRRFGVTALTLPLLLRYGYVPGGSHDAPSA